MKTSTKVTIGLSVVAVAGIATAVVVSEKVIKKVASVSNRRKVKHYVHSKFNGNETLLNVVDKLEDKEIDSLLNVASKVSDGRDKVVEYGTNVKDKVNDFVDNLF